MAIDASANWTWRAKTQAVIDDPNAEIPSYGLLNGTIGFGAEDGSGGSASTRATCSISVFTRRMRLVLGVAACGDGVPRGRPLSNDLAAAPNVQFHAHFSRLSRATTTGLILPNSQHL